MSRAMRESALYTALMLAMFAVLMTVGFWLRHGQWIWEAI